MVSETGRPDQPGSTSEPGATRSQVPKTAIQLENPTQSRKPNQTKNLPQEESKRRTSLDVSTGTQETDQFGRKARPQQLLERYLSLFAHFIKDETSLIFLRKTGVGRTNHERSTRLLRISHVVVNILGDRLKAEARDMHQRVLTDIIKMNSERITSVIAADDGGNSLMYTPDINRESRIDHFLKEFKEHDHVSNHAPSRLSLQLPEDGLNMLNAFRTGFYGQFRDFVLQSKALGEVRASLRRLVSRDMLDAISAEMFGLVQTLNGYYTTLYHDWDLFGFLQNEFEGGLDIKKTPPDVMVCYHYN